MEILVTGGAGFVGAHLIRRLLGEGHHVVVLDDLSTGLRSNVPKQVEFHRRSVCDPLEDLFATLRPEVVFHLAAQVSVPHSVMDPARDLQVNTVGAIGVMEQAAKWGVPKVVALSSAAVYGQPVDLPLTEASPAEPISPYGLSKLAAERYIRMLGSIRGVAYTIIRPANIFGPGQATEGEGAVIPAFLHRFLNGRDPIIHGDGLQTRDFIYVADMVDALVKAMECGDGLTLNVSSGQGTRVIDLWRELAQLVGWRRPPVFGPARAGDIEHSVMANGAAWDHLAWRPRHSLTQGLQETVAAFSTAAQSAATKAPQTGRP